MKREPWSYQRPYGNGHRFRIPLTAIVLVLLAVWFATESPLLVIVILLVGMMLRQWRVPV